MFNNAELGRGTFLRASAHLRRRKPSLPAVINIVDTARHPSNYRTTIVSR